MVVGFAEMGKSSVVDCLIPLSSVGFLKVKGKGLMARSHLVETLFSLTGNNLVESEIIGREKDGEFKVNAGLTYYVLHSWSFQVISKDHLFGLELVIPKTEKPMKIYFTKEEDREKWLNRLLRITRRATLDGRTRGVDIQQVVIDHPVCKHYFKEKKGHLVVSVWDFAGQHEYYNSHHHFLSTRSVYLVLWKLSEGDKGLEGIKFWLSSSSFHLQAHDSEFFSIIVVGTHYDALSDGEKQEESKRREAASYVHRRKNSADFRSFIRTILLSLFPCLPWT